MGLETGVLVGIGMAAAGVGSSIVGASSASSQQKKQMSFQSESQEAQNNWQSAENDKDRVWQESMWQQQFAAENAEWRDRYNMMNNYNDPKNIIQRLRSAGINPAAAMGQLTGTGGMAAAGGSSSPVMPALGASHSVAPLGIQNPTTTFNARDIITSASDMINAITNRERLGLDTKKQEVLLPSLIKQLETDSANKESVTYINKLNADIISSFGKSKASAELQELLTRAVKNQSEGKLSDAQSDVQKVIEKIEKENLDIKRGSKADLIATAGLYNNTLKTQASANQASAAASYAAAEEHKAGAELKRAQSITEDALREGRVQGQDLVNSINEIAKNVNDIDYANKLLTNDKWLDAYVKQLDREGLINDNLRQKIELAKKENNVFYLREFFHGLESTSRSFDNVTRGVSNIVMPWQ